MMPEIDISCCSTQRHLPEHLALNCLRATYYGLRAMGLNATEALSRLEPTMNACRESIGIARAGNPDRVALSVSAGSSGTGITRRAPRSPPCR